LCFHPQFLIVLFIYMVFWRFLIDDILLGGIFITKNRPFIGCRVNFFNPFDNLDHVVYIDIYETTRAKDLLEKISGIVGCATPSRIRIDQVNNVYISNEDRIYPYIRGDDCDRVDIRLTTE